MGENIAELEIWKPVFDSKVYEVSNMGKVRNKHTKQNIAVILTRNYPRISLTHDINTSYNIYNLITKIFIKNFDNNLYSVKHKDNDILNNKLDNLELILKKYATPKINNLTKEDINANEKEWFILKECEDYEITKCGLIRNRKTTKLLKPYKNDTGYIIIHIKIKVIPLHRLLANNFIQNPNNYLSVDHINRIKSDNRLENLRWASDIMQNNNQNKQETLSGYEIHKYSLNNEFITKYKSTVEASKSINTNVATFRKNLKKIIFIKDLFGNYQIY